MWRPANASELRGREDYFAAFCFAQRFLCAAAILARASALKNRFFRGLLAPNGNDLAGGRPRRVPSPPTSNSLTCWSRSISSSIAARIALVSMRIMVPVFSEVELIGMVRRFFALRGL